MWYNSSNRINNDGKVLEAPARRLTTRKGEFRMATSDITTQELETEEWRDVPGYEGLYQVSNLGRVRRTKTGRVLRPGKTRKGYFAVSFSRNSVRKSEYVHSCVARAFLGTRPEGLTINHKDGNKSNNCAANLEYCTNQENRDHAVRMGLLRWAWKKNAARNERVKSLHSLGWTVKRIADELGMSRQAIHDILRR